MTDQPSSLPDLFPRPRLYEALDGQLKLGSFLRLQVPDDWTQPLEADLAGLTAALKQQPRGEVVLRVERDVLKAGTNEQSYELIVTPRGIDLFVKTMEGARFGLRTLRKLCQEPFLSCCRIADGPALKHRGVQIDLARVIERPETVKRLLALYASLNINVIQLCLENAFVFASHPKLARPFAWTLEQAREVAEAAKQYGIGIIPAIQSLGHCTWVGSHEAYRELDEGFESGSVSGVLCPSHPRTLEMIEGMVRDVAPLATAGIIHLGMDEVFTLGQCSRCAPRRREIGEGGIYLEHANRVAAFARAAGKRPAIWGDMFYYYPDQVPRLDKDVLIFDWYYYTFESTPRVELFNFEPVDSLELWKRNGLEAWGCPCSVSSFVMPYSQPVQSIENARNWSDYLHRWDGEGMMVTQWLLELVDIDLCIPIEGAVAALLWEGKTGSNEELLGRACDYLYGRPKLGGLIERLVAYRFHGHRARRWLNADSLAGMITYAAAEPDLRAAEEIAAFGAEIAVEINGAKREADLQTFPTMARWLEYQYQKRAAINDAARDVAANRWAAARARLSPLTAMAEGLESATQALWDRNRYPDDAAPTPMRLRKERQMFEREMAALKAAVEGQGYEGELNRGILLVHVRNTHPGAVGLSVEISEDGVEFSDCGQAWIIQFDSRAARPISDEELTYTFLPDKPEKIKFVKITSLGCGRFSLRGVTLHQGSREKKSAASKAYRTEGEVVPALGGDLLVVGPSRARQAFYDLLDKEKGSSAAFSAKTGHAILELK